MLFAHGPTVSGPATSHTSSSLAPSSFSGSGRQDAALRVLLASPRHPEDIKRARRRQARIRTEHVLGISPRGLVVSPGCPSHRIPLPSDAATSVADLIQGTPTRRPAAGRLQLPLGQILVCHRSWLRPATCRFRRLVAGQQPLRTRPIHVPGVGVHQLGHELYRLAAIRARNARFEAVCGRCVGTPGASAQRGSNAQAVQ